VAFLAALLQAVLLVVAQAELVVQREELLLAAPLPLVLLLQVFPWVWRPLQPSLQQSLLLRVQTPLLALRLQVQINFYPFSLVCSPSRYHHIKFGSDRLPRSKSSI
jgi:hypothetical protein